MAALYTPPRFAVHVLPAPADPLSERVREGWVAIALAARTVQEEADRMSALDLPEAEKLRLFSRWCSQFRKLVAAMEKNFTEMAETGSGIEVGRIAAAMRDDAGRLVVALDRAVLRRG